MILDVQQYLPYLEGMDLSDEQKEELIRTVWGLMESQVQQAFDAHLISNHEQIVQSDSINH